MATQTAIAPTIEAHAMARYIRMSPQKARLVIDLIRGLQAKENVGGALGPENASIRVPAGLQQGLEVALVRPPRLRRPAARRRRATAAIERPTAFGWGQRDRHRACREQAGDPHLHGPAGDHHWAQGS